MRASRYTLCVLGAGTTGSAVALFAARAGLSVIGLERRALDEAGARWVNDVPAWMFKRAGLPDLPGVLTVENHRQHLSTPRGGTRITVEAQGVAAVDMRALSRELHERAREAGAILRGDTAVVNVEGERITTASGEIINADFVVDATGLAGINLLNRPRALRTDLCVAAQAMHTVKNLDQAHAHFAASGASGHDALVQLGAAGGYSVLNIKLIDDQLFVLSGSLPALGFPSAARVNAQFVAKTPWVGPAAFGGERAIPLAPPITPFVRGRHAHVGDAANQVFAAHGSGTGSGLVAARILVDALVRTQSFDEYARQWYREVGATHFVYDLLRRASMTLSDDDAELVLASGLLDEDSLMASMQQTLPTPHVLKLPKQLRSLRRARPVSTRMIGFLKFAAPLAALAKNYPRENYLIETHLWYEALQRLYARIEARTEREARHATSDDELPSALVS